MAKFKKVYVEITNICNLSCSFCSKTKRVPMEMSVENFERVIKKIKPFTDYIYMHVMGEPLNHSNIGNLLELCEQAQIFTNITTNGTLLKLKGREILAKKSLRQINISLHSFEKENKEHLENYISDIFSFAREAQKHGIIICLRLWNLGAEDFNYAYTIRRIKEEFAREINILPSVTDRNGIKLDKNIYLQQEERFVWPKLGNEETFKSGRCYALKTHIGILSDGTVVPCCIDNEGSLALGNIFEEELETIINSARATSILQGFRERRVAEDFCKTCGFRHNV